MISTDLFEPLCFAFSIPGKRVFHIVCIERALTLFSSLLLSLLYSCNMSSPFLFFHEIVSRDGDECACVSLPFGSALASHREECVCAPLIRAGVVEQDSERVASCSAFLFSSFVKRLVCGGAVPVKRSCCGGAVRSKLLMRRFTGVCRELLR